MNPPTRFGLLPIFCLCLFLSSPKNIQALCLTHPTDGAAVLMGSFSLTIPVPASGGPIQTFCNYDVEVCIWLLSSNRVDYVLNVSTIRFDGDCDMVDNIPFATIMDQFANGSVKKGTELGYSECGDTVDVWVGQCAERSGSGEETTFDPCNTTWCKRRYAIICGPLGTIYQQLVEDPAICNGVSAGCERGCSE